MLTWIRKRSGSRWVKILMILLALTFFGGFGLMSSTKVQSCMGIEAGRNALVYARIDGMKITRTEFQNAFSNQLSRRRYQLQQQGQGQPVSEDMIDKENLRLEVMDSLVAEKLIGRKAEQLGIRVSDDEVQQEIARTFTDQQGNFTRQTYLQRLRRAGISPAEFEGMVRKSLRRRRVQQSLTSAVTVLPGEVEEHFAFNKQKLKLDYLVYDPAIVAEEVEPKPARVKEYFEEHPLEFYLGETRRVDYVSWSVEGMMSGITVSEDELHEFYEQVKDRYKTRPEQANASHILVKVSPDAPESEQETARSLIQSVYEKIRAGADFSEMARQYSEDASAREGGELGWFARQEDAKEYQLPAMVEEFEKAAFSLEKGEVSKPVQTDFGFHLIKVTDRKPAEYRPFSEIRSDLVFDLKHGTAMMKVHDKVEKVRESIEEGLSLAEAAEEADKKVKTSNWFQMTDDKVFGLPDSDVIVENAFDLEKDKVSEPLEGKDHIYLIKVIEINPEHEASLEEVRPRIAKKLKPKAQLEHTREYAAEQLAKLKKGELTMEEAAEKEGIELMTTELQERGEFQLPDMEGSEEFVDELLKLSEQKVWSAKPAAAEDKVIVMKLAESRPPDMTEFPQYKASFKNELLKRKQQEIMENWIEQMEKEEVTYTDEWKEFIGEKEKQEPEEKSQSS
ncbi:MAG: SurA N-terminal domain-containing protein [bacterium]